MKKFFQEIKYTQRQKIQKRHKFLGYSLVRIKLMSLLNLLSLCTPFHPRGPGVYWRQRRGPTGRVPILGGAIVGFIRRAELPLPFSI